ncbi:hypothetical protein L598_000800000080 [Mesorhizobium sp. J18]|nr:hypothetical protein L598_000800000080 [Mesorhizobium sp. J18]
MLVQEPLCLLLIDAFLHGDEIVVRHQFTHGLAWIGSETDIAIGEDADKPARVMAAGAAILNDGDAGDAMSAHQRLGVAQGRVGTDGDRIDHHAGFELLDLTDFLGLLGRCEIAVDNADAAGLSHGDGETGFRHRVHCGRKDRHVEVDVARDPRADIGLTGHDLRMSGLQEHVVEGERLGAGCGFDDPCHGRPLNKRWRGLHIEQHRPTR